MSAPVITSITFDKPFYTAGETVTLTVNYTSDVVVEVLASAVATGSVSGQTSNTESQGFFVPSPVAGVTGSPEAVTWNVVDDAADTWTKVSDNGSVAVFTTVAP
jgi:hypothetical protein